jgi:hypothetical protein
MAYVSAEARQVLLEVVARAADDLALALASLEAAYERLDTHTAERLEEQLFRPVQLAYGRARRTYSGFATRHGLPARSFEQRSPGPPSTGVKGFLEHAVEAAGSAEAALAELQDSMMPVEVGDAELRAGLAEVRDLLGGVRESARELMRTLGR